MKSKTKIQTTKKIITLSDLHEVESQHLPKKIDFEKKEANEILLSEYALSRIASSYPGEKERYEKFKAFLREAQKKFVVVEKETAGYNFKFCPGLPKPTLYIGRDALYIKKNQEELNEFYSKEEKLITQIEIK